MAEHWRWQCERCGFEFWLTTMRMPEPCYRCGGLWFRKIGESDRDRDGAHIDDAPVR